MERIFDSHAHYDDEAFGNGAEELLRALHRDANVARVVDCGADVPSSIRARTLAEALPLVYFSAGIHPEHASETKEEDFSEIEALCRHPKCVAVGEIGLDYYYGKENREEQKEVLNRQLALAEKMHLPVIIHDREAHADCMEAVLAFPSVVGVFHSYSGSFEMAKELLKKGWYLSFNGIITFKNARKTVEVLEGIRDYENGKYQNRVLVETDCPYLAPVPLRGSINRSDNIRYTAERCGEILGIGTDAFLSLTYQNACRFFGLSENGDEAFSKGTVAP